MQALSLFCLLLLSNVAIIQYLYGCDRFTILIELIHSSLRSLLQIRSFFWDNCPLDWADLDADATVNTGCKINPVPVTPLDIFTRTLMDTGNGASINAIRNTFAGISNNRVWQSVFPLTGCCY